MKINEESENKMYAPIAEVAHNTSIDLNEMCLRFQDLEEKAYEIGADIEGQEFGELWKLLLYIQDRYDCVANSILKVFSYTPPEREKTVSEIQFIKEVKEDNCPL